jgi:hypothetical protein
MTLACCLVGADLDGNLFVPKHGGASASFRKTQAPPTHTATRSRHGSTKHCTSWPGQVGAGSAVLRAAQTQPSQRTVAARQSASLVHPPEAAAGSPDS